MHLSISQLSELTGRDRRTMAKQLSDFPYTVGERCAMLYESVEALPLVYAVDISRPRVPSERAPRTAKCNTS